ncbi:nuclear protein localization protein 4 homolog [Artemia franciscana]|uniref:MPN domain-containing protein n=1 Tax=Artemia franciscana TaxID=6661 RepID=A0AA88HUU9_ARTSF|nr:hypothetical protein QYM36_010728 [Artemia franciscana]
MREDKKKLNGSDDCNVESSLDNCASEAINSASVRISEPYSSLTKVCKRMKNLNISFVNTDVSVPFEAESISTRLKTRKMSNRGPSKAVNLKKSKTRELCVENLSASAPVTVEGFLEKQPRKMILRIQSSEGTKRIEIDSGASTKRLYKIAYDSFGLKNFNFIICKDRGSPESSKIKSTSFQNIKSHNLQNGELLFIVPINNVGHFESVSNSGAMNGFGPKPAKPSVQNSSKLSVVDMGASVLVPAESISTRLKSRKRSNQGPSKTVNLKKSKTHELSVENLSASAPVTVEGCLEKQPRKMILRIQSSEGTKRIEIDSGASTKRLYEIVYDFFGLKSFNFIICKDRRSPESSEIKSTSFRNIKSHNLQNGELLFIVLINNVAHFESVSNSGAMNAFGPKPAKPSVQNSSKLSVVDMGTSVLVPAETISTRLKSRKRRNQGSSKTINLKKIKTRDLSFENLSASVPVIVTGFLGQQSIRMILRIQTSQGTKRIEIDSDASTKRLCEMVCDSFGLKNFSFIICKDRRYPESSEIKSSPFQSIKSNNLKNGELLFIVPINNKTLFEPLSNREAPKPVQSSVQNISKLGVGIALPLVKKNILEDKVDRILEHETGRIERGRDAFCQHGSNSRCVRCSALEPFDEKYLSEHNIKHMSFHASLRKVGSAVDRGKFAQLDDIMCTLKPFCLNHPPHLTGGCSRCRPGAITLTRQLYRHVDNVEFENPQILERFLNYWRITGNQRAGHLYGWYEPHKEVPLGIKTVVVAIYEPPQQNSRVGIKFLDDPMDETVNSIAKEFGLERVGWIFTDLETEDPQKGTVKNFRDKETFFLSAQECILAGKLQGKHPNPCKYSSEGRFGSKFTTLCVTGDENNQVHIEGYQVSNQCMSLARNNILIPTKDAPELGYIRDPEKNQYVPDVFYMEKDEYGNETSKIARPFPVEYLLVDVPVATPLEPVYTFHVPKQGSSFSVENRSDIGETQNLMSLQSYLKQFEPNKFLEAASDFHFLIFITSIDFLPIKENIKPLIDAIKAKDMLQAYHWREEQPWATLEQLL